MKTNAPKVITWAIALILGIVGIIGELGKVDGLADNAFWLVTAGLVILLAGSMFKGL